MGCALLDLEVTVHTDLKDCIRDVGHVCLWKKLSSVLRETEIIDFSVLSHDVIVKAEKLFNHVHDVGIVIAVGSELVIRV